MKTFFDNELEEGLKHGISTKEIIICNSNIYFEFVENNFPIFMNRIDWQIIHNKEYDDLHYIHDVKQKKEAIDKFLLKLEKHHDYILNENLVIIGDSQINMAYCMSYSIFKQNAFAFFSIPQHTFVLFERLRKCINLTFEGDLYFG